MTMITKCHNCVYLFILLSCCFSLLSCGEKGQNAVTEKKLTPLPDAEIVDFITRGYKNGSLSWYIKAKKADIYNNKRITRFFFLHLYNYGKDGSLKSTASANEGTLWEETEDILLKGDVMILNEEKTLLETDSLKYVRREKKIKTSARVKITRKNGDILRGKGLIADIGLKKLEILSQVRINSFKK